MELAIAIVCVIAGLVGGGFLGALITTTRTKPEPKRDIVVRNPKQPKTLEECATQAYWDLQTLAAKGFIDPRQDLLKLLNKMHWRKPGECKCGCDTYEKVKVKSIEYVSGGLLWGAEPFERFRASLDLGKMNGHKHDPA